MSANTGVRQRNRSILRAKKLPCALQLSGCQGINYSAVYPARDAFTVDHIVPLARGGSDSMKNLQPACAHCNWTKNKGKDEVPMTSHVAHSGAVRIPSCACPECQRANSTPWDQPVPPRPRQR